MTKNLLSTFKNLYTHYLISYVNYAHWLISNNNKDRLVDQHRLVNQQLAVTTVLFVKDYMITHHFCQLLEHAIIVKLMTH